MTDELTERMQVFMPLSGPASRNRDQNQKLKEVGIVKARGLRRQCQEMAEEQVPKPSKNQRYCAKVKGQQPSSIFGIPITRFGIESSLISYGTERATCTYVVASSIVAEDIRFRGVPSKSST